ncbi:heparinase II/III domain-containing protein [Nocardia aurea]|uniref:heparinase II/III domain-containing protein n=1 Tax=Nocardia aurea TaxID=2144174 RepID=UPI0018E5085E|nr:heparinase II/III family protein [Nocardia aurea]
MISRTGTRWLIRVTSVFAGLAVAAGGVLVPPASAAGSAAPSAAASADTPGAIQLLRNGGFESGTTAPASWTPSGDAGWSDETADSGTRSLKVASQTGASWAGSTAAASGLDARQIASVKLSGAVRLESVEQGATADNTAKVSLAFVDATGKRTWKGVNLTGTRDWTRLDQVYPVPAGTVSAFVSVALDRARGTAWFDSLSLTPETWVNLVPNPSLELATPSTETCPAPAWCTPWQSSPYEIDAGVAAHGGRSMRITGSATKKIGGFVTVPLNAAQWPVAHVSAKVKLDKITLASYADYPAAARVALSFSYINAENTTVYTGSGVLGGILTGTTDWTTVSGTFRLPPLTTRLQIIPFVQTSTGTMWVDDVRVTPESPWISPGTLTRRATAGATSTHLVTVTNRRTVADSLKLSLDDSTLAPFTATVTPPVTPELKPGESATVAVTTTVPDGQAVDTERTVVLTATPSGDAALAQPAALTTRVAAVSGGPKEPHVYNTPAQLKALRERIAGQPWARSAFATVVKAEADAWLGRPLDKTVHHGGWSGNFKCPGTNTMLEFDYATPTSHRCPLDGKSYSGEPYDSAWTEIWHNNAAQGASDLALTYRLVPESDPGREKYAAKARDILVHYADRFMSVPLNGLYGRVHYQSLDEAVAAIGLIDAYDLVRETLSAADRVNIEGNLLRPLAEMLISTPMSIGNFQAWTVAAVYGVGAAIDDAALRRYALHDPAGGAEFLLDKAVVGAGWWWEGSASYHLYAMQALTHLAIAARNLPDGMSEGKDYTDDSRFRSMHFALLPYLYPDMTVPVAGDGGTWGRRFGPNLTMFAEWAYAEYRDPDFAAGLGLAYHNMGLPRQDRWALRYGADSVPRGTGARPDSVTFRGLGETVLRGGGPANLAPNGGFEEAALSGGDGPSFWTLDGAAWAGEAFSGERALSVEGTRERRRGASQKIAFDGRRHRRLRLSAMVRTAGLETSYAGGGRVVATFLDGAGRDVGGDAIKLSGTSAWSARELSLDVPPAARAVRLGIEVDGARGTLQADDLDLWVDDLVGNGGFESGTLKWRQEGRAVLSPLAYRGSAAAMVPGSPTGRNSWTTDVPLTGGNIGSVRLAAMTRAVALLPVGGGSGRVELSFVRADGTTTTPRAATFRGAAGWTPQSVDADVPKDAVAARIGLAVVKAAGVAFFDDVSLRFGSAVDPFQANAVRLDHGIPGGVHGHADKLHLDVVGGGGLQSTDLGQVYGASNRDLTENWYRESVSHNTVVVDGRSQDRDAHGKLAFFGTTPRLRVVDAVAEKPYASVSAMADVSLRRAELMTDEYTLDVADAQGSSAHRYDQSWHGMGALEVRRPQMGTPPAGRTACSTRATPTSASAI